MVPIRFLHTADLHLDSSFATLSAEQARLRRREMRRLPERLCDYVNATGVDLVLLAGDLFDSTSIYRDTADALRDALGGMQAQVFIAPGNHDCYTAHSPYVTLSWPDNVHIFRSREIARVELPELGCAVYGAAFVETTQETSLLAGFSAPDDGFAHLMVLHGDLNASEARYNPLTSEEIAVSNLDYLALGHVHRFDGAKHFGRTLCAYAGCPEGRGFDELDDKGVLVGTLKNKETSVTFLPFAQRHYRILRADVTDTTPERALRSVIPKTAQSDFCRVIFTGETDERGIDVEDLRERFASDFFSLELRDETHIRQDVWAYAREDSLRGAFLRELYAQYDSADEAGRARIERAVRFGLAALDGRE